MPAVQRRVFVCLSNMFGFWSLVSVVYFATRDRSKDLVIRIWRCVDAPHFSARPRTCPAAPNSCHGAVYGLQPRPQTLARLCFLEVCAGPGEFQPRHGSCILRRQDYMVRAFTASFAGFKDDIEKFKAAVLKAMEKFDTQQLCAFQSRMIPT